MGPIPDLEAQQHRVQAELEHRFQPLVFLPSVQGRVEEATVPSNAPHSTLAFELRVWASTHQKSGMSSALIDLADAVDAPWLSALGSE